MSRKHKGERMFTRQQRATDTAARARAAARLTPEQRDLATIAQYSGAMPIIDGDVCGALAEAWLGLNDEPNRESYETELMGALARQYRRYAGHAISRDIAEDAR